jgi:hypothetical protein
MLEGDVAHEGHAVGRCRERHTVDVLRVGGRVKFFADDFLGPRSGNRLVGVAPIKDFLLGVRDFRRDAGSLQF